MKFTLIEKETGREIEQGEEIRSNNDSVYYFLGFTAGRLSPKIYVQDGDLKREFFTQVFNNYEVKERRKEDVQL